MIIAWYAASCPVYLAQSPGKLLQGPSSSNSPVTASVQLYASQPVPEQLRKVPAGATDAAQELFELINPGESSGGRW